MAGTLPALTLECSGCAHRWPTRAHAGSSIRCPECRRVRRVPADRPRTAAQAAATPDTASGHLTALWEAEAPPSRWRDCLGDEAGKDCPACGTPMRWTGAHTAVVCASPEHERAQWSISPGAAGRVEAHAAALDRRANRSSAKVADPTAERAKRLEVDRAAIELAKRKGVMLRQLGALADDDRLDPESLPVIEWFRREAASATTEDRLDDLADLLPESGIRRRHWWQGSPEALYEYDDNPDPDDDQDHAPARQAAPRSTPAESYWDAYDRQATAAARALPDDGDRSPGWIGRRALQAGAFR